MKIENFTIGSISLLKAVDGYCEKIERLINCYRYKSWWFHLLTVENLKIDSKSYINEEIVNFKEHYKAQDLLSLKELLEG
jgi:hypothetical protein